MFAKKPYLVATALVEIGAGLAFILLPRIVLGLLLATTTPTSEALLVGRLDGAALLALGIACWLARADRGSSSQHGLLCGILIYNVAACVLLVYAGAMLQIAGVLLWPGVVLHTVMAIWCLPCLWLSPRWESSV